MKDGGKKEIWMEEIKKEIQQERNKERKKNKE